MRLTQPCSTTFSMILQTSLLINLLPTGREERGVLVGAWSIPVAILPSCYDMKTIGL